MRIKSKDELFKAKKCYTFKRGQDQFFINSKFVKKTKKGTFFEFPQWATQIMIKHDQKMYKIFLDDFKRFYEQNIPIPFNLHFPEELRKTIKTRVVYEVVKRQTLPIISDYKSKPVEKFESHFNLELTHDELVIARRNGEI